MARIPAVPARTRPERSRQAEIDSVTGPSLIVAQPGQAVVAACRVGLAAINPQVADQVDARTDRVIVVDRHVIRDTALYQKGQDRLRKSHHLVHMSMGGV